MCGLSCLAPLTEHTVSCPCGDTGQRLILLWRVTSHHVDGPVGVRALGRLRSAVCAVCLTWRTPDVGSLGAWSRPEVPPDARDAWPLCAESPQWAPRSPAPTLDRGATWSRGTKSACEARCWEASHLLVPLCVPALQPRRPFKWIKKAREFNVLQEYNCIFIAHYISS